MLNNLNNVTGQVGKTSKESSKIDALDQRLQDAENRLDELSNDVYTERVHTDEAEVTGTLDVNNVTAKQASVTQVQADVAELADAHINTATIEEIYGTTHIREANIDEATLPKINGNVAVDGTLTTKKIDTEEFAVENITSKEVETDNLKVNSTIEAPLAQLVNVESNVIKAEDSIETKEITAKSIEVDTAKAKEVETEDLSVTNVEAEKIATQVVEAAEATLKELTNTSSKFDGVLDIEQELQTEEDWYTITLPRYKNAILQMNAEYKSIDGADTKQWATSIVFTPASAIIQWTEGDFNGIKDFSFDPETERMRIRVRAVDHINYHIQHNDLEEEGVELIDLAYGEAEDSFEVIYEPEAWRGYYLESYKTANAVDAYSVFRYNGVANLPGLRVDQKMFDDIYIKYNIWLPDYFDNDETPHFVSGVKDQYLSVTEMDVRTPTGEFFEKRPITSWHTPTDNETYPTALDATVSCLISERSVANYNGTETHEETEVVTKQYLIEDLADDYEADKLVYNDVFIDHIVPVTDSEGNTSFDLFDASDNFVANLPEGTEVDVDEEETSNPVNYPISELRDATCVHGEIEVETNATIHCNAQVDECLNVDCKTTTECLEVTCCSVIDCCEVIEEDAELRIKGIAKYEKTIESTCLDDDDNPYVKLEQDTVTTCCACVTNDATVDNKLKAGCIETKEIRVAGDLWVDGTTHTVDKETVTTQDNTITLRANNDTALAAGEFSGLSINKYNGTANLNIGADNTGTLRIGTGTGTSATYSTLYYREPTGKWYNEDKDEISEPSGILTGWDSKEEANDEDLGLVTKYTNAVFTVFNLKSLQPVATRAEEEDMEDKYPTCWNADENKLETTDTFECPVCDCECFEAPLFKGTATQVCAYDAVTDEYEFSCLLPLVAWDATTNNPIETCNSLWKNQDTLRVDLCTGDLYACHFHGIFDGSICNSDTVNVCCISDASTGFPQGYIIDQDGNPIVDDSGNPGMFEIFIPENFYFPMVATSECGCCCYLYGSDMWRYNCDDDVFYTTKPITSEAECPEIRFSKNCYTCGDYTSNIKQSYGGRLDITVNNGYANTQANASNTFCFCSTGDFYAAGTVHAKVFQSNTTMACVTTSNNQQVLISDGSSIWMGNGASSAGTTVQAIAIGVSAVTRNYGTVVGANSNLSTDSATAIGVSNTAGGYTNHNGVWETGIALGCNHTANCGGIMIGTSNTNTYSGDQHQGCVGCSGIAIGLCNRITGWYGISIGAWNDVYCSISCWEETECNNAYGAVLLGYENAIGADENIGIGFRNKIGCTYDSESPHYGGWDNIVIGVDSCSYCSNNVVIGRQAIASTSNSIAIGRCSRSNTDGGSTVINSSGFYTTSYRPTGRAAASWLIERTAGTTEVTIAQQRVDGNWTRASLAENIFFAMCTAGMAMYEDSSWHTYGAMGAFGCNGNISRSGSLPIVGVAICSNGTQRSARFYFSNNTTEDLLATNSTSYGNSTLALRIIGN